MNTDLISLERDVGVARARLAEDIAELKSPETVAYFKEQIKDEVMEAKDAVVEKTTRAAEDAIQNFYADVRARALANPAAALSIGAGIALFLLRHPPITTALVGIGVYSLAKTPPNGTPEGVGDRLRGQVEDFGHSAAGVAKDAADAAKEWSAKAGEAIEEGVARTVDAVADKVVEVVPPEQLDKLESFSRAANDNLQNRDNMLLLTAGLSVAAALGLALRRR
jgi:hypothetical protein